MHLVATLLGVPTFISSQWPGAPLLLGAVALTLAVGWCSFYQERRRRETRLVAQMEERTRIAREMHDTLLQSFNGITLQLGSIQRRLAGDGDGAAAQLSDVLVVADHTLREARRVVWEMHAPELQTMDLPDALGAAVRSAAETSDAALTYTVLGVRRQLPLDIETAVLRVGREAVVNAARHSQAQTIYVELTFAPRSITLRVKDDGRGFSTARTAATEGHWGLTGMLARAQALGGSLRITAPPEGGTLVSMDVVHRGKRSRRNARGIKPSRPRL